MLAQRSGKASDLYATSSSEAHDDPAVRLAFRVRYNDSFGREVVYYARNSAIGMANFASVRPDVKFLEDNLLPMGVRGTEVILPEFTGSPGKLNHRQTDTSI
ncbi:hypothetical protein ASPBRDRAFT_661345 [Aspergillus brasiliensis CBS 101740]|uniref:Uncharacterized protein n=1 Tax=Aspergillus brasiliensis (strain CBS 101740 / IMI 381727 / IBT 21946) TaxID=767769 RepID=A0A1L9U6V8_ASPBC|nr:hypothetical protein ASPBRDRAFT_661345 [Aspergillus brasiliensis CBS 101740]